MCKFSAHLEKIIYVYVKWGGRDQVYLNSIFGSAKNMQSLESAIFKQCSR